MKKIVGLLIVLILSVLAVLKIDVTFAAEVNNIEEDVIVEYKNGGGFIYGENLGAYVWGSNYSDGYGRMLFDDNHLGIYTITNVTKKVQLKTGEKLVDVSMGNSTLFLLTNQNRLLVSGSNNKGQLGFSKDEANEIYELKDITTLLPLSGKKITKVSQGQNHSGVLTEDGNLIMFGSNLYGQLGINDDTKQDNYQPIIINSFFELDSDEIITDFELAAYNSFALTSKGRIFSWGYRLNVMLGHNSTSNVVKPLDITEKFSLDSNDYVKNIATVDYKVIVHTVQGRVFVFGDSSTNKSLGTDFTGRIYEPLEITEDIPLESNDEIADISVSYTHSLILTKNGSIFGSGRNANGELLVNMDEVSSSDFFIDVTPTEDLLDGEKVVKVFAGIRNSMLLTSLNRVLFIGSNEDQSNPLLIGYWDNSDKLFDILSAYFTNLRNENIKPIESRAKSLLNMFINNQDIIDSINTIKNEAIDKINLETDLDVMLEHRKKALADLNEFTYFLENSFKNKLDVELVLPDQSVTKLETSFNILYKKVNILTENTSIGTNLSTFDLNGDDIEEISTLNRNEVYTADLDTSTDINKYVDNGGYFYEGEYYDFQYKDVNNDGYKDKIEIFDYYDTYYIDLYLNNKNNEFEYIWNNFNGINYTQPNIIHQDVNLDGLEDIIYANDNQNMVVYLNLGLGKYAKAELEEISAIKTFEVKLNDGTKGVLYQQEDGQIKIISLSVNDLEEVIITEKMTGSFVSTEVTLSTFDYDNDGTDDLIVHEGLDVFVYRAATSYQEKESIEVDNVRQVIIEDVDLDGIQDFILVKENYESLLVYRNNKFEVLATFENMPTGNYKISFRYMFGTGIHTLVLIEQDTKEIITFEPIIERYITNLEEKLNELNIEFVGIYDNQEFTGDRLTKYSSKINNSNRLFVKGTLPNYTITFDTKGGSVVEALTFEEGSSIVIDSIPTKEGYVFNGWKESIPHVMPGKNLVLTATWLKYESSNDHATVTGLDQALNSSTYENQNIEVKVDVEVLPNNNVLATEVNLIDTAIKNNLKYNSFTTFYLNITLQVENMDTGDKWYLTTTDNKITFQINIPSEHQGKSNYKIIRIHDGVAEVLETTYNETTKKVEFKSDKFSTYALVYETVAEDGAILPGNDASNNIYWIIFGSLLFIGILFIIFFIILRKRDKDEENDDNIDESKDDLFFLGKDSRHKMSFKAKLSLSSNNIRNKYAEIKTEIFKLEPAKTQISFKHEALLVNNKVILKIRIRGKAMHLYAKLPLSLINKLNAKDVIDIKEYKDTPLLLIIKEKDSLVNVFNLIEELKKEYNLYSVDRTIDALKEHPVLSKKKLIELGLIKKRELVGKYYLD